MRKVIAKEALQPGKFLRLCYRSRLGKPLLWLSTRRFVSKIAGCYLDSRLSRGMIKGYAKRNNIDLSQYEEGPFPSFNAFFTRRIRPELRPFCADPCAFPSPCDSKLSVYRIDGDCRFEIKGFTYTAQTLLKNEELAARYAGGLCLVFRLCVDDYHRYHYPDNCTHGAPVFLKGRLHTVQPIALENRRVFTENCREYTVLHTENFGDITQVEVGALMVGRIVNNHKDGAHKRGEEKGRFEFGGSTIVLLVEKDRVCLDEEFFQNTENGNETVVRCGERIGCKL
ncbi:MAG: phosphatidylserine decarboxylase [Ruminococcaceae bacterium]|nr:phosphatidylserine decarboxylase [Oscillospiraceae bacterium]